MSTALPRCLVIAGCTAVGKSSMAVSLARQFNGEIISGDSVCVYRQLTIGADKPSLLWRELVPHHLIDIADARDALTNPFTAHKFSQLARDIILDVNRRGKLPIVVGGSGMYLSFLIHGHDESELNADRPDSTTTRFIHAAFNTNAEWSSAITSLAESLPGDTSATLSYLTHVAPGNHRRLERAVHRLLQLPPSSPMPSYDPRRLHHQDHQIDYRCVFMDRPRAVLNRLIDARCERMLQHGLLDEVISLRRQGALPAKSSPALAIGYRQTLEYLESGWEPFDAARFRLFVDGYQAASRQLARRQRTWFKTDREFNFMVDADEEGVMEWATMESNEHRQMMMDEEYVARQDAARCIDAETAEQLRRYLPVRTIFHDGINPDTMLKLMAQRTT